MCSAGLLISEMVIRSLPSRKNTFKVSCGILSANSSESGERMPTKYEQLYQLQIMLKTAQLKLNKASSRVKSLEKQIAELTEPDRYDVT